MTGLSLTPLTALVTSAAHEASVPNDIPPPCTFGQLMLISSQPTSSCMAIFLAVSTYSSIENPLTLATIFLSKQALSFGSSSAMTLSTPGF